MSHRAAAGARSIDASSGGGVGGSADGSVNNNDTAGRPSTERERLATLYDDVWAAGRAALDRDAVVVEPLPVEPQPRWGISAVLRPRDWSPTLSATRDDLAALLGVAGFCYRPDNLHVTLRSFEGYRATVADDDAAVARYRRIVATVAARHPPVRLAFRGLTAAPSGVLLQGFPAPDLQAFRVDLHRALVADGPALEGPERSEGSLRRTVHATLALYVAPPDAATRAALVDFVAARRDVAFGTGDFAAVALVGFRRTADAVRLIEYGSVPLGRQTD